MVYKKSFDESAKGQPLSLSHSDLLHNYYIFTGKKYKSDREKKVFISYSWDSKCHNNWVKKLAEDLREHFRVEYDEGLIPGMSPNEYMYHNVLDSDFIIVVFTPNYSKKIISQRSSGAKIEYSIIRSDLFRKISRGKYLPILKDWTENDIIPSPMDDCIYIDFSIESKYKEKLDDLIMAIKNDD